MSLLPNVERELLRVAYGPGEGSTGKVRLRMPGRPRPSGGMLAIAVSVVALLIGAGFLVGLRGSGAGRGPATHSTPPAPRVGGGAFPGAPHPTRGRFTHRGVYVCGRVARNRYLPRNAGCVSVLRADISGGLPTDLVLLYADLGTHRVGADFEPTGFTLELVRPGGTIARTRVQSEPFPWITRVGNINGIPGDELVLHLDDVSSGDTYGIYTFTAGRIELVRPLLSAGGDSADKEGFSCRVAAGNRPEIVSRVMSLLGPRLNGRWRWTMKTYVFHGTRLFTIGHGTFVRRGLPGRGETQAGAGCGHPTGATQTRP